MSANSKRTAPAAFYAGIIVALVVAGSLSLFPLWLGMCRLWATDPLRSIGAIFPPVACIGVLAAWHRIDWEINGRLWALLLIALSILLAKITTNSTIAINFHEHLLVVLHPGLILFLYGVGSVLLFGGTRLLRVSILPLCLLLFINPVPYFFNSLVDLPLQYLSANTSRAFAHLIGLQPTGNELRMMFAPDFGMMIVPGCNGVRGSITLGYLALIFGYTRRLRPRTLAFTALVAFFMGYALNLFRLCILVLYYRIGVSLPSIQKYGAGVDYGIGCTLFLLVTFGLGMLIRSLEPDQAADLSKEKQGGQVAVQRKIRPVGYAVVVRALCFSVLALAFAVPEIRSAKLAPALRPNRQVVLGSFPAQVGRYRLTRTYWEHDSNGMIVLALADYVAQPTTGIKENYLTFGLWVGPGNHLVAYSKFLQGVYAKNTGSFDTVAPPAIPIHFVTTFYDDGISRRYDAEAICSDTGCSEHLASSSQNKYFISLPSFPDIVFSRDNNQLPILLRREWIDSDLTPSNQLRLQFEADARLFTAQLNLQPLLLQDGSRP
jgi:exosortase J